MSTTENTAGASFQLAPDPVSSDPTEFWHCVQLYDNDVFLSEAMSRFVGTGFEQGEGLVVIATETHCNALEERLKARGLDVDAARARGQYLSLDAEETLAKIMVNGRPDRERFINVVGEAIERLAAAGTSPRVRAFGEMVALLWGAGQQEAAQSRHTFDFGHLLGHALLKVLVQL